MMLDCEWMQKEMNRVRHPFGEEITSATLQQQFARLNSWEDKYRQLIRLGSQLAPLPDALKQHTALAGCESRVWFACQQLADGRFHFYADSDSRIVKGLLAVLLTRIEGKTATQLQSGDPLALFDVLDLRRQLTASRGQGLAALAEKVRQCAREAAADVAAEDVADAAADVVAADVVAEDAEGENVAEDKSGG